MQKRYIILIGLMLLMLLVPTNAAGIKIAPVSLAESGTATITNTGSESTSYKVSLSQIMQKDGIITIIDDVKADIIVSPMEFTLAPGASQDLTINIGNTNNMLYGVRVTEVGNAETGIKLGVSAIIKIANGQVTSIVNSLNVKPIYFPIYLSGIPVSVTYALDNPGNVPVSFLDTGKVIYPGDSLKVEKSYNNSIYNWGFVPMAEGVTPFVIPSPVVVLLLIVALIVYLRRNISIVRK